MLTYRAKTADGSSLWIEGYLRATTDDAGEVTGSILTLRDITERKRLSSNWKSLHPAGTSGVL